MNGTAGSPHSPLALAERLAELDHRLRHRRCAPTSEAAPPPEFVRIELALRLLADACGPEPDPDLQRLQGAFLELARTLGDVPERTPPELASYWPDLAAFLQDLLERSDRGAGPPELLRDPGWGAQARALSRAGGPLAILDDMQGLLQRWWHAWGTAPLEPGVRARLAQGWVRLRGQADGAFGAPPAEDPAKEGPAAADRRRR